jgi:hypothetical protein
MDERHLIAAAGSVALNPVRARLRARPEDGPWSSARAHLVGVDDELVSVRPLSERVSDWARFVGEPDAPDIADVCTRMPAPVARSVRIPLSKIRSNACGVSSDNSQGLSHCDETFTPGVF